MTDEIRNIEGLRVLVCSTDGGWLASERDVNDFISAAFEHQAAVVAIPTARLSDDFFQLRTRLAGEVIQKFVTHRIRVAIVGDIARWTHASQPLRDFITEANRGQTICFAADIDELTRWLAARRAA